jgi:hypothetical protein
MAQQRYLKNRDNYIYCYTDALAERDDMIECDKHGNPIWDAPVVPRQTIHGEVVTDEKKQTTTAPAPSTDDSESVAIIAEFKMMSRKSFAKWIEENKERIRTFPPTAKEFFDRKYNKFFGPENK